MTKLSSYKELIVWQKSIELVVLIYKLTSTFPREEIYGLISQLRRCAVSVPSNIAEGWSRKNRPEFINFLSISNGSAAELETQLIISKKLNFGDEIIRNKCFSLLEEVQKMLGTMGRNLRQ